MREVLIEPVYGLIMEIAAQWVGAFLTHKSRFLTQFNIPPSVTGVQRSVQDF